MGGGWATYRVPPTGTIEASEEDDERRLHAVAGEGTREPCFFAKEKVRPPDLNRTVPNVRGSSGTAGHHRREGLSWGPFGC